jgi:site-specific DNA recombinase
LEDQEDNAREIIAEIYEGPIRFHVIATVGKGERLDRPELEEIEKAYRSRQYDVFVFDDLSRLIRGGDAARLLGVGVDHGTRTICIDDGIDTVDETWEEDALNACSENVALNQRTSKRIKQKTMNRFKKYGATGNRAIMGYIVPEGAKSYDDWQKDPSLQTFILEGKRLLQRTLNGETVADFFRQNKVPLGPYARKDDWDGVMVLRYYRNTLLKGMPQRGKMATVKHHGSGRRPSKKNPDGPTYYHAPHLAFFDPVEFDELQVLLAEKNHHFRRSSQPAEDPRLNVPRKRTRSFGQHAICWYCGRRYVWGANGQTDNLMCSGAREWKCWNSIGFDGPFAAEKIAEAIGQRLDRLQGLDDEFQRMVKAAQHGGLTLEEHWAKQRRDEETHVRHGKNISDAVAELGLTENLRHKQAELEQNGKLLAANRHWLESAAQRVLALPTSMAELRELRQQQFRSLAIDSFEFGDLIRELVPQFYVYLVRLCDGGHLMPRAKVSWGAQIQPLVGALKPASSEE